MLVDVEKVIDFCGVDSDEDSAIVTDIHNSVEKWIDSYCNKTLLTGTYAEYYDGNGNLFLQLDHYPITGLTRVAVGRRSAIRVQNTDDYTTATISVTSTGVILTKNGTSDSTVTFAANVTMSAVVTAINAVGSGWSAVIYNSDFNSYKSTELVQMFGKSAFKDNWVYLDMPEEACDNFEVYANRGEIYRYGGWGEGHNSIYVEYTGGYVTTPLDLELAINMLVKYIYQKREEATFGVANYSVGDIQVASDGGVLKPMVMPKEVIDILNRYRRILI